MKTKKGFTLAETLIAMAILGILAAVTVPTLITTTNKHNYVNGLKRANLILKTATSALMANNSGTMVRVIPVDSYDDIMYKYCTVLTCIKKCPQDTSVTNGCFAKNVKTLSSKNVLDSDNNHLAGAVLSNGMTMVFGYFSRACNLDTYKNNNVGPNDACTNGTSIWIDINGLKAPNIQGRDIFTFITHKKGIAPEGVRGTTPVYAANLWEWFCDPTIPIADWRAPNNGNTCAGKVLTEGAMNY